MSLTNMKNNSLRHQMAKSIAPIAPSQRILSIDVLRGFALLGILASNIRVFAMVCAVVCNPTIFGDFTGGN
jgi:uncharacterized protein